MSTFEKFKIWLNFSRWSKSTCLKFNEDDLEKSWKKISVLFITMVNVGLSHSNKKSVIWNHPIIHGDPTLDNMTWISV